MTKENLTPKMRKQVEELRKNIDEQDDTRRRTDRVYWQGELRIGEDFDRVIEDFFIEAMQAVRREAIEECITEVLCLAETGNKTDGLNEVVKSLRSLLTNNE